MIENLLVGHSQKWMRPIWSLDSKTDKNEIKTRLKSQEWVNVINRFFACWYKFMQIERWLKILGVDMVKNGCGQSCNGALKLTVSEEEKDGINWSIACWYRFTKIKSWSKIYWVAMVKDGCGQSGHWTLKLTVSQKWADGINWFCACWYKFKKTKNSFSDFWVGMVKNGSDLLVHETLKRSAVSKERIYEMSWFFEC